MNIKRIAKSILIVLGCLVLTIVAVVLIGSILIAPVSWLIVQGGAPLFYSLVVIVLLTMLSVAAYKDLEEAEADASEDKV
jgi:membrane protein implicated in regulation of membrane protease activity